MAPLFERLWQTVPTDAGKCEKKQSRTEEHSYQSAPNRIENQYRDQQADDEGQTVFVWQENTARAWGD